MLFSVDTNKKVIFGWSPKCACSYIKNIYWFFQTNKAHNRVHSGADTCDLPDDIENYITLIFCRNPYKRLVSGFLEKYRKNGQYRCLWKEPILTFSKFVDKLTNNEWNIIDRIHFEPQTNCRVKDKGFEKKILMSKTIKFIDINNIDFEYMEQLYDKKIPPAALNKKWGHERRLMKLKEPEIEGNIYDLHIDDYIEYNIDSKSFYNEEIEEKVFNFFIKDFKFFEENGIKYTMNSMF
jgi:hypothetical protein